MFNCHCQDTKGMWIRLNHTSKLFICDSCKGCREVKVSVRMLTIKRLATTDPNFNYLLRRHKARLAE